MKESYEDLVKSICNLNWSISVVISIYSHLIVVVSIALCCCREITASDSPSFECLAAYSKAKGFIEPEFDVKYDSGSEECTKNIAKFSAQVRKDIVEKMAEVSSDKKQSECIMKKFTDDDVFVNNIIKGEALAASEEKEKSDKLRVVEKFAEEFITTAITTCFEVHEE